MIKHHLVVIFIVFLSQIYFTTPVIAQSSEIISSPEVESEPTSLPSIEVVNKEEDNKEEVEEADTASIVETIPENEDITVIPPTELPILDYTCTVVSLSVSDINNEITWITTKTE